MRYDHDTLRELVRESNRIEAVEDAGRYHTGHMRALEAALVAAEERTVLHPRVVHRLLGEGIKWPADHRPGDYRRYDVYVNLLDGGVHRFPHWPRVGSLMQDWWFATQQMVLFGNPSTKTPDAPWRFHAWFESIHPFIDGNGRVGRVVMWNLEALAERDLTLVRFEERFDYYDRLQAWRNENADLGV